MRQLLLACMLLLSSTFLNAQTTTFHSFNAVTIYGDTISLSQYAGKKLLVVNTASFCAYTHQFANLEAVYEQYHNLNFELIGFPCNDFGNQDPGSDSTILEFCTNNYNVTFPMMSRIQIKTGDTAAVYKWLQRGDLNGVADAPVTWNFNKFLIDANGNWVQHYDSPVEPDDSLIVNWILEGSETLGIPSNSKDAFTLKVNNGTLSVHPKTTSPFTVRICSLMGTEIAKGASESGAIQFPTSTWANGIYLVDVVQSQQRSVQRVILSH